MILFGGFLSFLKNNFFSCLTHTLFVKGRGRSPRPRCGGLSLTGGGTVTGLQ